MRYSLYQNRVQPARLALIALLIPFLQGCPIERLFPEKVADGAARLTVNNFGNLMLALKSVKPVDLRPECDFTSLAKNDAVVIDGQRLSHGTATWAFDDCVYDFGTQTEIEDVSDCGTTVTRFSGKVRLSGKKVVEGIIIDSDGLAIIPQSEDGIEIQITRAHFENYSVESPGLDKAMTIVDGEAAFTIKIHLAKAAGSGLCLVPTPNLTIENIRYNPSNPNGTTIVKLPGMFGDFHAEIGASELHAQVGEFNGKSNQLVGKMAVWGNSFHVPTDGQNLDPSFRSDDYQRKLSCQSKLEWPISYQCQFDEFVGATVARLLVLNVGSITKEAYFEDIKKANGEPRCGFESAHAHGATKASGQAPYKGQLVFTIDQCPVIDLEQPTFYETDCTDQPKTYLEGVAIVKGSQTITGERKNLTNGDVGFDPADTTWSSLFKWGALRSGALDAWMGGSIIPRHPQSVAFQFDDIYLNGFAAHLDYPTQRRASAKLVMTGHMQGRIMPIMAEERGKPCEYRKSTPIVDIDNVTATEVDATLWVKLPKGFFDPQDAPATSPAVEFSLPFQLNSAQISGRNGKFDGVGNFIKGQVTINGKSIAIDTALDPDYDQDVFDESYGCRVLDGAVDAIESTLPSEAGWWDSQDKCHQAEEAPVSQNRVWSWLGF